MKKTFKLIKQVFARIYYNDIVAILEDDYNIKSLTDEKINSFVREFIDDVGLI